MRQCIRYPWFILAVLALLFSACQAEIGQPTASPTLAQPSPTLPTIVKATNIILPTATNTPPPSKTPTPPVPSPTSTSTPDWTTFDLEAWMSASPDGLWVARIVVAYPPKDSEADRFHVWLRIDSYSDWSKGWIVIDEWLNIGLGMTTPTVLRWAEDGAALFIADTGVPDGCGPVFFQNVRRVDLLTGETTLLDEDLFGRLSVSPDGSILVELTQDRGLLVHDLQSGDQHVMDFVKPDVEWWPGEIVWSPDGQEFLFVLNSSPCGTPEKVTSSIWKATAEGGEAGSILQDDPRWLSLQSWPEACLVQVNDREGSVWWLDPCSGELSQTPPEEVVLALDALIGYFDSLNRGDFVKAVGYYGGSYEHLSEINLSVDPYDHAALLSNACLFNGYQCLPVFGYVLVYWGEDEFHFLVTFNQDGAAFVRGPCCGASAIDQPPDREFTYTVVVDADGAYRVQELPVYVP